MKQNSKNIRKSLTYPFVLTLTLNPNPNPNPNPFRKLNRNGGNKPHFVEGIHFHSGC